MRKNLRRLEELAKLLYLVITVICFEGCVVTFLMAWSDGIIMALFILWGFVTMAYCYYTRDMRE